MEPGTDTVPMTVSGVARLLRCSADLVRYLERTGRLRATRTDGGIRLFAEADVRRLAAERARRKKAEA
jgi:excisionase family DNA binding protein